MSAVRALAAFTGAMPRVRFAVVLALAWGGRNAAWPETEELWSGRT